MIQLGLEDEVLACRTIWLCVSCQTCTTRCPNQIDLGAVMDALRRVAMEAGTEPAEKDILAFHEATLETIRRHGRLYELGMIARLKLRTGHYTKDMGMGIGLMSKGKIRLFASNVRDRKQLAALFARGRAAAKE
jgi:heterodisulfide reductase subunit C